MKTLIVYYSNTSNNELLALHLQKKLGCDILKIEELKRRTGLTIFLDIFLNRNPKLKSHNISLDYDHFIFVAPIWAGKIASPLKAFMRNEKNHIKSYSFITLCGGGMKGQKDKIRSEITLLLGQAPKAVEELWISSLPVETAMTSNYRANPKDLEYFKETVDQFVNDHAFHAEVV